MYSSVFECRLPTKAEVKRRQSGRGPSEQPLKHSEQDQLVACVSRNLPLPDVSGKGSDGVELWRVGKWNVSTEAAQDSSDDFRL